MPRQSLLRTVKRWLKYEPRSEWSKVPRNTRGLYVLYVHEPPSRYFVSYIGVAGLGKTGGGGIRARLKSHDEKKPGWTHFSLFEVHDNVTREEIRELEALMLSIFRDDNRIGLSNRQVGSRRLATLRKPAMWGAQ